MKIKSDHQSSPLKQLRLSYQKEQEQLAMLTGKEPMRSEVLLRAIRNAVPLNLKDIFKVRLPKLPKIKNPKLPKVKMPTTQEGHARVVKDLADNDGGSAAQETVRTY